MKLRVFASLLLCLGTPAYAQEIDIEVPEIIIETGDRKVRESDDVLDLANIVQSAAKGQTTVQEAPAIVTVITADEIRDRQLQDVQQILDGVPGWQRINQWYSMFPTAAVRGHVQSLQFLHDGLALFDAMSNVPSLGGDMPIELIKRIEMITGPGGVLWGSNSLLGMMNVSTKDADDVDGVETGSGIGHGRGDRLMARAYVMAGAPDLLGGKLKVFGHGSVETSQGPEYRMPMLVYFSPVPQPNSENYYGPLVANDPQRSLYVSLLGKVTFGNFQLRAHVPFADQQKPLGVSGNPHRANLPEDSRCSPEGGAPDPSCGDNLRRSRDNRWRQYDRYVVAEYRDRFANDRADILVRGYGQQFLRGPGPFTAYTPSTLVPGGLSFTGSMESFRAGGALDVGVEIGEKLRVLTGAEAFHEWMPNEPGRSRGGAGAETTFAGPYDLNSLPLLCPRVYDPDSMSLVPLDGCPLTFAYLTSRTVLGAYVNPQLRMNKQLTFDVGARVQAAPEQLGTLGYDLSVTTSGTVVWSFVKNWYLKLNYAQGFRPPVFNNTSSNGEAVQIAGNPDLKVETSDALQAEVNARVFKGERSIRELSFRVDASYTRLQNIIQIQQRYNNTGDRGIASAELLAKLYVKGGHRLELGYTWMRVATSDRGLMRSLPENSFNFTTVWNLLPGKVTGTTNLRVIGSTQDVNRLAEYRDLMLDGQSSTFDQATVASTDLVLDRLPPVADLSLGMTWTPMARLSVQGTIYNALAQHAYVPDIFFDYAPQLEFLPNPYEGIRAYASATYQY